MQKLFQSNTPFLTLFLGIFLVNQSKKSFTVDLPKFFSWITAHLEYKQKSENIGFDVPVLLIVPIIFTNS